jgi:hypothetical protein
MTKTAWLLTINEWQPSLESARSWPFWILAPRDRDTGEVRRRKDGQPFTPQWGDGEDVFIYYPGTGRIVAWLTLDGAPEFDEIAEEFLMDSTVNSFDPAGPTLADIGVELAVEGGRQRLTPSQHGAAARALRRDRPFDAGLDAAA